MEEIEVYITRDVLSAGIRKSKAVLVNGRAVTPHGVYEEHEWHLCWDSAKEAAERIRKHEIEQLKGRLKNLRAIKFSRGKI